MRYYLDTNIVAFLLKRSSDDIAPDVRTLFADYGNLFYTSTICVHEIIHLNQIGKLELIRNKHITTISNISLLLDDLGVEVKTITMKHLETLASLPLYADHRDPNDRLIVAQAISDQIPLISSDRKFSLYVKNGLQFIYNRR